MSNHEKQIKDSIQNLVAESLRIDKELRDKYQIGDKFRFIREGLQTLSSRIEAELQTMTAKNTKAQSDLLSEDETLIYIYIFNAQGLVFQTWQKMLNPGVFYEYSVNRPAYCEKAHVESYIRSRSSKAQHGYLTIVIKKTDLLSPPVGTPPSLDSIGNPLQKIKEGCLKFERMISFTHQEIEYLVNESGLIIKKENF